MLTSIKNFHPLNSFIYFVIVLFITMFTQNLIVVGISFMCSVLFNFILIGGVKTIKNLMFSVAIMLFIIVLNGIFVHNGVTPLFFLNGNAVTKESLVFGCYMALLIASVIMWFNCYNVIVTSEKFLYLFSRVAPKLSLLISMAINYISSLKGKYLQIVSAQKVIGLAGEGFLASTIFSVKCFYILLSSSLENSIDKADSMNARGYYLKGRSSFSAYRWTIGQWAVLAVQIIFAVVIFTLIFMGVTNFYYYPKLEFEKVTTIQILAYATIAFYMLISTILQIKEILTWRLLKRKI